MHTHWTIERTGAELKSSGEEDTEGVELKSANGAKDTECVVLAKSNAIVPKAATAAKQTQHVEPAKAATPATETKSANEKRKLAPAAYEL